VMTRTYDLARKRGVKLAGAVTWAFEFENQPYFRGFRDLATNGIDKPVLNVFRMLGMMTGDRVLTTSTSRQNYNTIRDSSIRGKEADVNALATRTSHAASVMVWNYHDKNDVHVSPASVSVIITGLPQHRVFLRQYIIDQEEYKTLEAAGQLKEISYPKYITPDKGLAKINFDLERQGTTLLKITW
jgi:xylan 1,4-beta-xylosidase